MTQFALTSAWQKIANAGSTVEVQLLSVVPVKLTLSAGAPASGADGEVLRDADSYRKYDAPLPNDLYGCANTAGIGIIEVIPIGSGSSGGVGSDTIIPGQLAFTTTEHVLALGASYTLAPDTTIKYLDIEVVDQGAVRFTASSADPASATHGKVLAGADTSPGQGGEIIFETSAVPTSLSVYALAATTVSITVGR